MEYLDAPPGPFDVELLIPPVAIPNPDGGLLDPLRSVPPDPTTLHPDNPMCVVCSKGDHAKARQGNASFRNKISDSASEFDAAQTTTEKASLP